MDDLRGVLKYDQSMSRTRHLGTCIARHYDRSMLEVCIGMGFPIPMEFPWEWE